MHLQTEVTGKFAKSSGMRAVALNEFGGPELLTVQTLPLPQIGPNEVLMHVKIAGVGEWDPFEREGGYAQMTGMTPSFPYILGSEGAGVIAAVGEQVRGFKVGDEVYAASFLNPKGGFYAEYAAVHTDYVSHIPGKLTLKQAGVMGGVGITALRGLQDTLKLQAGESVMIFGASGGVGHIAVQLAKRMGARVFAVASGKDGVALVKELGADAVVDGHKADVLEAARKFAPDGFDAALFAAGGAEAKQATRAMRVGGRIAYPNGVQLEQDGRLNVTFMDYNGEPDANIISRFNQLIDDSSFSVHVAQTFALSKAAEAHAALDGHYLGKLALRV